MWHNWPSFVCVSLPEVSWLSGREEAVWIPPPETVPHQRPDHRLWPSTRPVVVTVRLPRAGWEATGTKRLLTDPQTASLVGSWSCWDTVAQRRAAIFFFQKVSWDHRLVIKCGPLTWVLVSFGWILFCCKRVTSLREGQIFYFNEKWLWSFLPNYISVLYQN